MVGSGVPQGNHIGPLHFLLFIDADESRCLLFVVNLKSFKKIKSALNSSDLEALHAWCEFNFLDLNIV